MTLERFAQDSAYRRRLNGMLDYCDWPTLTFKEIRLDTSDILHVDMSSYYYLGDDASRLVIVWMWNPKRDSLEKCLDSAIVASGDLLAANLPEIANVKRTLSLFYSEEVHKFLLQRCELSRSRIDEHYDIKVWC